MARMRGIVGIEAAIVLIAFVLVASALAFVAINMGMFASQKSKEVMAKAYESSTRALDIAGDAIAKVDTATSTVTMVYVPIKLTAGTSPIDLSKTVVSLLIQRPDAADKAIANAIPTPPTALTTLTDLGATGTINSYEAKWFISLGDTNTLLEPGELAILAINVTDTTAGGLPAYSAVQVEIKPPVGAPLVVKYQIPPVLTSDYIDLVVGG
ncbi:putative flagellin [Pyrodictium delaneyi]|uniref:Flagellin n=1 Tax=Pyrodictium delaneyi TaxID=1273541 RepID=A0A0N7JD54_9CREN|nr:archaellin/type IV pilin N-terminal domain-containing protein [Pyrodictium delaneyi]ALL01241.1 putative flagellin [Pyrodictium delaneyi]OWJ55685.1 hypothetical protein Pdsh_02575 [Pyrodictium delaneyi]